MTQISGDRRVVRENGLLDGLYVKWRRQGDDLGLMLLDFADHPWRTTLISVGDQSLIDEPRIEIDHTLDLMLSYYGKLAHDEAWLTILGAEMLPIPLLYSRREDLLDLLTRLRGPLRTHYGPWWSVTQAAADVLKARAGWAMRHIVWWAADDQAQPTPWGWQEAPGNELNASEAPRGQRLGGERGWRACLCQEFRGLPVPRPQERMVITLVTPRAADIHLTDEMKRAGGTVEPWATGTRIVLPGWNLQMMRPVIRLAYLPNAVDVEATTLDRVTRLLPLVDPSGLWSGLSGPPTRVSAQAAAQMQTPTARRKR